MTKTNDPNDTQKISPRRVYHCKKERKFLDRANVWKDHNGKFHCTGCSDVVEDVTNTTTGQWALQFIML